MDIERGISKAVMMCLGLYMAYIGLTCPCSPYLYSCHLMELYIAVIVFVGILVYWNGFRFFSY